MKFIMGIDPGSQTTGYGVVAFSGDTIRYVTHGVIQAPAKLGLGPRLAFFGREIIQVFEQVKPQAVAVEKIFLGKNVDSAFKLGHVRGVFLKEAAQYQIDIYEYAARFVKRSITGSGASTKEQVSFLLSRILGVELSGSLDASDALAVAICHCNELGRQKILERLL